MWILGSQGQLGTAVVNKCRSKKIPFIATDSLQANILHLEKLKKFVEKNPCTHVINCAAYTNVDQAEKEPEKAHAINAIGPQNLGILGKEFDLKVLHVSTDYVFDGKKNKPYVENDLPNPLGIYGKSKYEGEKRLFEKLPNACIFRTSWIFGQFGKNFISSIFSLLKKEEVIKVVSDQINKATYHDDLAEVLIAFSDQSGIFHFANEKPLSRYQIVQDFFQEINRRRIPIKCKKIIPISSNDFSSATPRPLYSVLSTEKVSAILGRKPRLWETVLSEYLDHVIGES